MPSKQALFCLQVRHFRRRLDGVAAGYLWGQRYI